MALKLFGSVSGRNENKIEGARFHVNHKRSIAFLDESNLVFLCHKLSKTLITPDSLLDPSLKKHYTDDDYHYMYVGEIMEVMAR